MKIIDNLISILVVKVDFTSNSNFISQIISNYNSNLIFIVRIISISILISNCFPILPCFDGSHNFTQSARLRDVLIELQKHPAVSSPHNEKPVPHACDAKSASSRSSDSGRILLYVVFWPDQKSRPCTDITSLGSFRCVPGNLHHCCVCTLHCEM